MMRRHHLPALALALLAWPLVCSGGDDILLRAYTRGSADKRAELAACQEKLAAVREKARAAAQAPDWARDPDVQWLLSHRIPAMLTIEREIDSGPRGHYVGAMVYLVGAISNQRLTVRLPDLLPLAQNGVCSSDLILKGMADHGGTRCLAELQTVLEHATAVTPSEEICVAAEGLARTGNKEYLPLLRRAYMLGGSDADNVRLAAARYRCGDTQMTGDILRALKRKDASVQACLYALEFLGRYPTDEAVPVVAALAAESMDEKVAEQAMASLMLMTGYGAQSARRLEGPEEETAPGASSTAEPQTAMAEAGRPGSKERKGCVEVVLAWWRAHPGEGPLGKGRLTRADALAGTDNIPEH